MFVWVVKLCYELWDDIIQQVILYQRNFKEPWNFGEPCDNVTLSNGNFRKHCQVEVFSHKK